MDSSHDLTDISRSYIKLAVSLTKGTSKPEHLAHLTPAQILDPSEVVPIFHDNADQAGKSSTDSGLSVCNNLFHSLFGQVELYINEKRIESVNDYPYISYINNLLLWDIDAKNSALSYLEGFIEDTPGQFDSIANLGSRKRIKELILNGKTCYLKARINLGAFKIPQFIPNLCRIRLVLHPKRKQFVLNYVGSGTDLDKYGIHFEQTTYELRRIKVLPSALEAYEQQLKQ